MTITYLILSFRIVFWLVVTDYIMYVDGPVRVDVPSALLFLCVLSEAGMTKRYIRRRDMSLKKFYKTIFLFTWIDLKLLFHFQHCNILRTFVIISKSRPVSFVYEHVPVRNNMTQWVEAAWSNWMEHLQFIDANVIVIRRRKQKSLMIITKNIVVRNAGRCCWSVGMIKELPQCVVKCGWNNVVDMPMQ